MRYRLSTLQIVVGEGIDYICTFLIYIGFAQAIAIKYDKKAQIFIVNLQKIFNIFMLITIFNQDNKII